MNNEFGKELMLSPELKKTEFAARKAVEFNVATQKRDLGDFNVNFRQWFHESTLHQRAR